MTVQDLSGPVGTVAIPTTDEHGQPSSVTFTVTPLTVSEEIEFESVMRATVQAERKAARDAQLADLGSMDSPSWAHRTFVTELVQYVMLPVNGLEIDQSRMTLAGTRSELFYRARKANPALKVEHVNAAVTMATWQDAREQLNKIIRGNHKATKS